MRSLGADAMRRGDQLRKELNDNQFITSSKLEQAEDDAFDKLTSHAELWNAVEEALRAHSKSLKDKACKDIFIISKYFASVDGKLWKYDTYMMSVFKAYCSWSEIKHTSYDAEYRMICDRSSLRERLSKWFKDEYQMDLTWILGGTTYWPEVYATVRWE